jgi:hypothetical protein
MMIYEQPDDPTPDEIAALCRWIRSQWNAAERERRRRHDPSGLNPAPRRSGWQPPEVHEADLEL